jgi:hypothetical protein
MKYTENINFTDMSSIKNSNFEIYDGSELIKSDFSYNDVCKYLSENKYKLFNKYVKIKILNKCWDAEYFLKHELV